MISNGAPRHSVTVQTASYDVIVVKLHTRDRTMMTVKGLETTDNYIEVNSTFSGFDSNNLVPRSLGFVYKRFGYEIVIVR